MRIFGILQMPIFLSEKNLSKNGRMFLMSGIIGVDIKYKKSTEKMSKHPEITFSKN